MIKTIKICLVLVVLGLLAVNDNFILPADAISFPCQAAIKGSYGLYANEGGGGNFNMQSTSMGPNETFKFVDLGGDKFAIQSIVTGLYANAAGPDGTENFNMQSRSIGQAETLTFIDLGGNNFAISSYVGRYAFTEGANFYINRTSIGQAETLTLVPISGCISLDITVDPQKAVPGETITVVGYNLPGTVQLKSEDGTVYAMTGVTVVSADELIFEMPLNIPTANYSVVLVSPSGIRTSSQSLTVNNGGRQFSAATQPTVPTQGLPGFGQLIEMVFTWSLSVLGVVVFVMIFYAGFQWFTAAGNTARVNEARTRITNAITGAIILLAAYIILYTINPDLVGGKFTLPGLGTSPTGGGGGGGGGTGVCRDLGGTANYAGALRNAINAVIAANPEGIADQPNTAANGFKILGFVAAELQRSGFNATTNVKNGNDNPNQGDLIAVWKSGDTTLERYDAISGSGAGTDPLRGKMGTDYTGDIPLSCAS